MDQEQNRHVPYDIEVEQAVLGSLLVDNKLIDEVSADLGPEHFYEQLHGRLFEMIVALHEEGDVSPLVVHATMKNDPGLQEVGGHGYLVGLAQAAPALPRIANLARILIEHSQRRGLIRVGEDLVAAAYSGEPSRDLADRASESILRVTSESSHERVSMADLTERVLVQAERSLHNEKPPAVLTGLKAFDDATGGLRGEEHIGLCARSGMGKSALAVSLANGAALLGHPVLLFNLDNPEMDYGYRVLCELDQRLNPGERPIWTTKLRNGTLSNQEIERLAMAQRYLHGLPFEICNEPSQTAQNICARARSFASKYSGGKPGLIVVDFLQTVEVPAHVTKQEGRARAVGQTARSMRWLARKANTNWPVLSLVQLLNKGDAAVQDHIPTAEDIRESGDIEAALDIAFAVHRPAFFLSRNEPDRAENPVKWEEWRAKLTECNHRARLIGLKFRGAQTTKLNLDLWCDMGCNAFRDERPMPKLPQEEAAEQLAMGWEQR